MGDSSRACSQGIRGKTLTCLPQNKASISIRSLGSPLCTRSDRPTRAPSTHCSSTSRKCHSLAKHLFEVPAEQPGSLPQQTPPQALWLPCFILNVPVTSGHCHPSGPCVLLTPLTATSGTEALQGHFCPHVGLFCDGKRAHCLPLQVAGRTENSFKAAKNILNPGNIHNSDPIAY